TTLLTVTATVTNSSRASRFRGWSMVSVCSGGGEYQVISRLAPIGAATAGQKPPTAAAATPTPRRSTQAAGRAPGGGGGGGGGGWEGGRATAAGPGEGRQPAAAGC